MKNCTRRAFFDIRHSLIHSSFAIRHSSFRAEGAFTIVELLVVITIIIVLAGLILATTGYVQKKGARSRAETEIAAMSAALESYKADTGTYPSDASTDALDARQTSANPINYQAASLFLFKQLSGLDAAQIPSANARSYFTFKPQMLGGIRDTNGGVTTVTHIRDPFGNSYGYSTAYQHDVDNGANPPTHGYNPTFDLWSTGGVIAGTDQSQWIKNW